MRILVVDDERVIREGMETIIDWERLGCQKLTMAESADQALKFLEKEMFDLVITDIYMSHISGIQLAKCIKKQWPMIKVIILSAYEDFNYAREAIEAGVFKYLLKPIVPEELEEALLEAMERVSSERKVRETVLEREKLMDTFRPQLVRDCWKDILRGEISNESDFVQRTQLAGIQHKKTPLCCMLVQRDKLTELPSDIFYKSVCTKSRQIFGESEYCVQMSDKKIAVLLTASPSFPNLMEFCYLVEKEIQQNITAASGRMVEEWWNLSSSLRDAAMILETRMEENTNLIAASLRLIDKNIDREDFGVNDLAEELHVSSSYFSRLFKKNMEMTCIEYITRKRIEKAKELLEHTDIKHQDIAQAVGYANVHYFSMQFKKYTGETPGHFRKRVTYQNV